MYGICSHFYKLFNSRVGHTFPMLIGFVVALLSTIGFAFLNEFGTLLAARYFQGMGSSLMTIAGTLNQ